MKKFLKIFFIIIAVILILILIHTVKNFVIITKLQENLKPYLSSTNHHIKSVGKNSDNKTMTMNYYVKDKKQVMIQERNENGVVSKISMYNNGDRIISYYDTEKIAKENNPSAIVCNISNYFELCENNTMQKIFMSIVLKIKNEQYNEKNCYVISPIFSGETNIEYIEKDTGLSVKTVLNEMSTEKEYEFNNVNDEIFTEPDVSQYRI